MIRRLSQSTDLFPAPPTPTELIEQEPSFRGNDDGVGHSNEVAFKSQGLIEDHLVLALLVCCTCGAEQCVCRLDGLRRWQHPASTVLHVSACWRMRFAPAASGDPVLGYEGTSLILVGVVIGCDSLRGFDPVQSVVLIVSCLLSESGVEHAKYRSCCP